MIIRHATVTIQSGKCSRDRAEQIVRSMFQQVHGAMSGGGRAGTIDRVDAPLLEVSFARSDDASIARDAAAWTTRWIGKGRRR